MSQSPHWGERPEGVAINAVVIHATGGSASGALAWFADPASGVSCHILIDVAGTEHRVVSDSLRAWHAGRSSLHGVERVNDFSLGLELEQRTPSTPYTDDQLAAAVLRVSAWCRDYTIPLNRVVGHEHVAPGRKVDPGPLFPWYEFLRRVGHYLPTGEEV